MCGIAGIINFIEPKSNVDSLTSMVQSMKNRGPDDEGYLLHSEIPVSYFGDDSLSKNHAHIHTATQCKFKVGYGFRQLKIIDLSNKSHQPMTDSTKRYWIIFNGEIYNYKEIRSELEKNGHHFLSNSDTEVVLKSYIQWGEKALKKFNGMFAFSVLDTIKNEVFIARDRIGIKPLYFYTNNQYFVFASTIKSIIQSKLYTPQVNWEGLWQNFRFSISQRPNTSYKDIYALEPAHYLKINLNDNSIQNIKYWEIPVNTQDKSISEKQALELIEDSLKKAVNYRLISDVEVGTFMSGGIDSTLVSVLASKTNPQIKALTLGFKEHKEFDEIQQASDTASLQNLNHKIHYINSADVIKSIEQSTIAYEEPYFHLSANFELAKMASNNKLKVVLSGLGGDELFGGYDVYNKLSLWNHAKKFKNIIKLLPNLHKKIEKGKQLALYNSLGEFYSHYYTNYSDDQLGKLFNKKYKTAHLIESCYAKGVTFTDNFEAMSFFNLKSYIGNHQMRATDSSTMAFSVEGRFPLLDHHFIETAFKIPTKFKLHNGLQKYALKEVAKKHIAPSCLKMNKKGLMLPLNYWISNDLKEFVYDTIYTLKRRQLFNNTYIERIAKSNDHTKIWQLVSTELWLQNFIDLK